MSLGKARRPSISSSFRAPLQDGWSGVRVPARAGKFSLRRCVQTGSGAHQASYPRRTKGTFPEGKLAGAWSWPLTSISCWGQRMSGVIPSLPQYALMAWCLVKHREIYNFILPMHNVPWSLAPDHFSVCNYLLRSSNRLIFGRYMLRTSTGLLFIQANDGTVVCSETDRDGFFPVPFKFILRSRNNICNWYSVVE